MATCTLDDIENLGLDGDDFNIRPSRPTTVTPKVRLINRGQKGGKGENNKMKLAGGNTQAVPGTETIWMKTFGCAHNVSDGEYMQGTLAAYGYTFTSEPANADLWFLNSCTVKNPSETAFMNLVKKAKAANKGLVVAGCVPQGDRKISGLEGVSIVGVSQIDRVTEVVEETLKGHTVRLLSKKTLPSLDLPKIRKNPFVEIVPISTGCLGACTYCKTKHARGKLGSYSLEALSKRVKSVIDENIAEVWLSSEDTGAWGIDLGLGLPDLLETIVGLLPEDQSVMLRVGMTNPPYMLQHLKAVAKALNHPCVFSFLHVPLQSASDNVLEGMNREYTCADFRQVADYLLEHVPGMTLATDIICGFPGESEADHKETVDLLKHYKLPVVNISQFYPRPGTEAKKMKQINTKIKKARSREVTSVFLSYKPYEKSLPVGTKCRVWVANEVSSDGSQSVAHTKSYCKVLIPRDDTLKGAKLEVEVTSVSKFHVEAKILKVHFRHSSATGNNPQQPPHLNSKHPDNVYSFGNNVTGSCGAEGGECCGGDDSKEDCCGGSDKKDDCCGGSCSTEAAASPPAAPFKGMLSSLYENSFARSFLLGLFLLQAVMMIRNNFIIE
jgi:threonylcarbamoyladenosine tRNA methylthiotransferase CDKAL1